MISPSTAWVDKVRKMPIYAQNGVPYAWLVDPVLRTLDAFGLEAGRWLLLGSHGENDRLRVEPFQELELNPGDLWR